MEQVQAQIKWTEEFSVGVGLLDDQHKTLVSMINRLLIRPQATTESYAITNLLYEMLQYTREHFSAEEKLMRIHDDPHLDAHIAEHRAYADQLVIFCDAGIKNEQELPETMRKYLQEWLVRHILKTDMKSKPFFHASK